MIVVVAALVFGSIIAFAFVALSRSDGRTRRPVDSRRSSQVDESFRANGPIESPSGRQKQRVPEQSSSRRDQEDRRSAHVEDEAE